MELVILSGKGGTGKTTIASSLSELAKDVFKVDCDVDASNLYLFYEGENIEKGTFYGGKKAVINKELCNNCGKCESFCKFHSIKNAVVDDFSCEGCGTCALVCKENAIKLIDKKEADVFVTKTDKGMISRAEICIGADGSGKLITLLRKNGKRFNENNYLTIIDGSPGIGCPVISSVTGSNAALIVTEPTISGFEDLKRVIELCNHFGLFIMICINKFDINEKISKEMEHYIKDNNLNLVGKIPFDNTVMKSINELKPLVYYKETLAGDAIKKMWSNIKNLLNI